VKINLCLNFDIAILVRLVDNNGIADHVFIMYSSSRLIHVDPFCFESDIKTEIVQVYLPI